MAKTKRLKRKGRSAAFMRSINPYLNKKKRKTTSKKSYSPKSEAVKMAKKRYTRKKRSSRRTETFKPMAVLVSAGAYGALRSRISTLLSPVTSKIPLGNIGDEVGIFFLANYLKKQKTLKPFAKAAMYIEAARIGEAVITGEAFGNMASGSASNGGFATLG